MVAARNLESALKTPEVVSGAGLESANTLVHQTDDALSWLASNACPHPDAATELRATLGVLRNAAFAFRRAVSEAGDPDEQLILSCQALLGQGRHHLLSFEQMTGIADL